DDRLGADLRRLGAAARERAAHVVDEADLDFFLLCLGETRERGESNRCQCKTFHGELLLESQCIRSPPFSAPAMTDALVFPETTAGMIEASTTRRAAMPLTRRRESTTDFSSVPIRPVEVGWKTLSPASRQKASQSSSVCTFGPGSCSSVM